MQLLDCDAPDGDGGLGDHVDCGVALHHHNDWYDLAARIAEHRHLHNDYDL